MTPPERPAWLPLLLLLLVVPALLLWPLPLRGTEIILAAPGYEAASHLWGLWAAWTTGQPLVLATDRLAWPTGVRLVLVDPANLPWFGLGHALGGPALGYNLVLLGGLALAGLAGALLARELRAPVTVSAMAAMLTPPLLAAPGAGLTEDMAVGWVGVQLALLLRVRRTGRWRDGLLAALAMGACAWSGPYNGMLAALVDLPLALRALADRRALVRVAATGLGGLVLAAPVIRAVLVGRGEGLPGSASRAGLLSPDVGPERFRGGLMYGVDLLDPWLPAALTGGVPEVSHTGYLGVVALVAAVVAATRRRPLWPWLAGAAALTLLALGPHLTLAGRPLQVDGQPLLGPAGLLGLAIPAAGRITRWYRAAAVAGLLLAPLVADSVRGRPRAGAILVAGLVLDALLLAPLPWPLPHAPLPHAEAWRAVAQVPAGPVLELPLATSGTPAPGDWRDAGPAAQALHGRPLGGAMMGLPPSDRARDAQRRVQTLLRSGGLAEADRQALARSGFVLLALRTTYLPLSPGARQALDRCLGPPLAEVDGLRIHALPPSPVDCAPPHL
ncbi:hypothetical protein L6R53_31390 [Myxococcota bacterium]|nr:hypothetical protein [Myxococcota bacterium]